MGIKNIQAKLILYIHSYSEKSLAERMFDEFTLFKNLIKNFGKLQTIQQIHIKLSTHQTFPLYSTYFSIQNHIGILSCSLL